QEAHIFNDTIHVGMGAAKAWPDKDARNASSANGLQLFLGWRLSDYWGMQFSSSYFNYETGNSAVSDHYRSAAGLDLLWLMRKEGWQPFLLAGAGAAYNDVYPNANDGFALTARAGLGRMSRPLGSYGLRLRAE